LNYYKPPLFVYFILGLHITALTSCGGQIYEVRPSDFLCDEGVRVVDEGVRVAVFSNKRKG